MARALLARQWVWLLCQVWYAIGFIFGWVEEVLKNNAGQRHNS
jgi:hypothetical protein